jgi:YVTN family beta-propeller protein
MTDRFEGLRETLDRPVEPRREFADELLQRLLEELDELDPDAGGPARQRRAKPAHRVVRVPRRLLVAVAALLVFVVPFGLLVVSFNRAQIPTPVRQPAVAATIVVGVDPHGVATGFGSVWVGDRHAPSLIRIDPSSNQVIARIRTGSGPLAVTTAFGAVWTANSFSGTVTKIDPVSDAATATVPVGGHPSGIAASPEGIWVTDPSNDVVIRIDPLTDRVTDRVPVAGGPADVAAGFGAVWIADSLDGSLSRIDPPTDSVERIRKVGAQPIQVVVAEGSVWVLNGTSGVVTRVDPTTDRVVQRMATVEGASQAIVVEAKGIWVASTTTDRVLQLDLASGRPLATVSVNAPESMAPGLGALWVADAVDGTIVRIDPGS